jgi:hypothetical protein
MIEILRDDLAGKGFRILDNEHFTILRPGTKTVCGTRDEE